MLLVAASRMRPIISRCTSPDTPIADGEANVRYGTHIPKKLEKLHSRGVGTYVYINAHFLLKQPVYNML